jgi:hypothetical protein
VVIGLIEVMLGCGPASGFVTRLVSPASLEDLCSQFIDLPADVSAGGLRATHCAIGSDGAGAKRGKALEPTANHHATDDTRDARSGVQTGTEAGYPACLLAGTALLVELGPVLRNQRIRSNVLRRTVGPIRP